MIAMTKGVMTSWLRYIFYLLPLISAGVLFSLFTYTNPVDVGPLGILAVFLCIYLFWLGLIFAILHGGLGVLSKVLKRRVELSLGARKAYYVATVVAFIPVLLLGMQSVGQLEVRDVALVFIFSGLAIFYILRRS